MQGDAADPELRRRRQETSTELAMAQHELNSVTATLQRHAGGDYSAAGD